MLYRRNEYDVTNSVNTTDPRQVSEVACLIYRDLYQQDTAGNLGRAADDLVGLYRGEYPGYHECDTGYHDLQHVMDVTLAMARLMDGCVRAAARVLHFTGYEIPVDRIRVPGPEFRLIGNLLGSADILAQMADRCYLEKCYDRLYPEFVRGGIARKRNRDGSEEIVFASAADLIFKMPRFYQNATKRLKEDLGSHDRHIEKHFGGQNLYFDALDKNINYARSIASEGDISLLRRKPPTISGDKPAAGQRQLI